MIHPNDMYYVDPGAGSQNHYDRDKKQWVSAAWYGPPVSGQAATLHPTTAVIHNALAALGETAVPAPSAHVQALALDVASWCTMHLGLSRRPRLAWFRANDPARGRLFGTFLDREFCVALADNLNEYDTVETVAHEAYHAYQWANNLPEYYHPDQREAAAATYARQVAATWAAGT